jgi:glycerate kinase
MSDQSRTSSLSCSDAEGNFLAAPDKFRGTASAQAIAGACVGAAVELGWNAISLPLADGGEGLLEVLGGESHFCNVTGPLGVRLDAEWRMLSPSDSIAVPTAVIEMATASGLKLVGGASGNDPIEATTIGTGELIIDAVNSGASRIIVGCGGSASTDGGVGALSVIGDRQSLCGAEIIVACDVSTRFLDAARLFAPQKGAGVEAVNLLSSRLKVTANEYLDRFGFDVRKLRYSGAAGGLAGGLAAIGASLVSGFDLVADLVALDSAIMWSDVVVTGEGRLDAMSFKGKVVGGVITRARGRVPVLCIGGEVDRQAVIERSGLEFVSLVEQFGKRAAIRDPTVLCAQIVERYLANLALQKR